MVGEIKGFSHPRGVVWDFPACVLLSGLCVCVCTQWGGGGVSIVERIGDLSVLCHLCEVIG